MCVCVCGCCSRPTYFGVCTVLQLSTKEHQKFRLFLVNSLLLFCMYAASMEHHQVSRSHDFSSSRLLTKHYLQSLRAVTQSTNHILTYGAASCGLWVNLQRDERTVPSPVILLRSHYCVSSLLAVPLADYVSTQTNLLARRVCVASVILSQSSFSAGLYHTGSCLYCNDVNVKTPCRIKDGR